MASKEDKRDHDKQVPEETKKSKIRSSSRRSDSFSSLSSISSHGSSTFFPEDFPVFSPTTPLRFSSGGIPFSWEKLPGIPKKQSSKKILNPSSMNLLLPLPPSGNSKQAIPQVLKKFSTSDSFKKDPFFAALVECSKDDQEAMANYWKGSKSAIRSNLSDRYGFINIYTSCKRTCAVSESLVYLPRSTTHYSYSHR